MTHHLEIETPDTVRRAQWAELDQAIFNVDCYLIHFAGDPEKLAIALDRLQTIADQYRRHKQSLPIGYRRKRDI